MIWLSWCADQRIDLADAVVDHRHGVLVDGHALVEDLGGEFREHVAGVVLLAVVVGHAALAMISSSRDGVWVELSPDCSAADDGHGGFSGKRVRPAGRPGFAVTGRGRFGFRAGRFDFLQAFGVGHHVLQQLVEVVVAVELGQQVAQALARLEQATQRDHLLHQVDRVEVLYVVEAQLDVQLAVVAADGVVDLQGGAGRDGGEDLVEVVAVDVDETPFDQLRRRVSGLPERSARMPTTRGSSFFSMALPISTS